MTMYDYDDYDLTMTILVQLHFHKLHPQHYILYVPKIVLIYISTFN